MQFLVIARGIDAPVAPPQAEIAAVRAMFEGLAAGADPRVVAAYAFAGERGGALVVEAASGEELNDAVASLPAARFIAFEVHALMSIPHALQAIGKAQQALASQMAQGPGSQG